MDAKISKQIESLLAQAGYLRATAATPPADEYDADRIEEAEAFEAGADALRRIHGSDTAEVR